MCHQPRFDRFAVCLRRRHIGSVINTVQTDITTKVQFPVRSPLPSHTHVRRLSADEQMRNRDNCVIRRVMLEYTQFRMRRGLLDVTVPCADTSAAFERVLMRAVATFVAPLADLGR